MTPSFTLLYLLGAPVVLVAIVASYWWFRWPHPDLRRAQKAWQYNKHAVAYDIWRSLVPRLEQRRMFRELATARLGLAAFAWEQEQYRTMAEQARRAVDEAMVRGKAWQQLAADTAFGLSQIGLRRAELARKPLEAAEVQSTVQGRHWIRPYLRTGLGWVHWAAGNRQMALDYARAACTDVEREPGSVAAHPMLSCQLGRLCYELGLWEEALARLDETQAHATTAEQSHLRAKALYLHAVIQIEQGVGEDIPALLERAASLAQSRDQELLGYIHLARARFYETRGQVQPARLALEQARGAAAAGNSAELACRVALALAAQHRQRGQYREARELLVRTQAQLLSEEPGALLAHALYAWGDLFLDQGDDREAYAHFRLADRLAAQLGRQGLDCDFPYRFALLHYRMGLLPEGLQLEQEGDQLRRKLGVRRLPPGRDQMAQARRT